MCEPHYGNQDFSPLITLIIKKTPLSNGNSPNTDPITKMGLEHAFEPDYNNIKWFFQGPVNRGGKDNSYEIVSELTSNDVEEEVYSSLNDDPPSMKSKRHKIDITERSSKCLCPYLHPKTWGVAYFDPKKYTLNFCFHFWNNHCFSADATIYKNSLPLNFPYGQKLKIHVGNWLEELSVISNLCQKVPSINAWPPSCAPQGPTFGGIQASSVIWLWMF